MSLKLKSKPVAKNVNTLEILKPKNRHLESLESERILLILNDLIKNCNLISVLDTIVDDLEEFSFLLGRTLYGLFVMFRPVYKEYTELCKQFMVANGETELSCMELEVKEERDAYTLPDNFWTIPLNDLKKTTTAIETISPIFSEEVVQDLKSKKDELEFKLSKMSPKVQHYVESILIAFRQSPLVVDTILGHKDVWGIRRNLALVNLIGYLNDLRHIVTMRLLTTPQERDERARFLAFISRKEKQHQQTVAGLKRTLDQLKLNKQKMVCQMNSEITELQRKLYVMEIDGKNVIHCLEKKTGREQKAIKSRHEVSITNLQNELVEVKTQYEELVEKNKANELSIRRRKWKLETETESWINKYDNEMADLQLQYDNLKKEYDVETKAYEDLKKIFEPLEKEYLQVLEERRIQKEKDEAQRAEHEALVYWATVIQSFWRAWKARKVIRKNRRR